MQSLKKTFRLKTFKALIGAAFLCLLFTPAIAQKDTTTMEHLRGQSGIDPILIHSKMVYGLYVLDSKGPAAKITLTPGVSFGVKNWGVSIKASAVSNMTGNPGDGFHSGFGDIKLSVQNRIFSRGKHAAAVSGELALPTGNQDLADSIFH
jgi:hypothetical protein